LGTSQKTFLGVPSWLRVWLYLSLRSVSFG